MSRRCATGSEVVVALCSEDERLAAQDVVDVRRGAHRSPDHVEAVDVHADRVVGRGAGSGEVGEHLERVGAAARDDHVGQEHGRAVVAAQLDGATDGGVPADREIDQLHVVGLPSGLGRVGVVEVEGGVFQLHGRALGVQDVKVEPQHLLAVRIDVGMTRGRVPARGHPDLVRHHDDGAVRLRDFELTMEDVVTILVDAIEREVLGARVDAGVAIVAVRGAGVPVAVQVHVGHEAGVVGGEVRVGGEESEDLGEGHGMSSVRRLPV